MFFRINQKISHKSAKLLHENDRNKIHSPQHQINLPTRKINRYTSKFTKMEKCFPMLCYVDINTFNTLHACTGFEPNRFDINLSTIIINLNQQICCTTRSNDVQMLYALPSFKPNKKFNKTLRLTQIFLRFSTTFINLLGSEAHTHAFFGQKT